MKKIDKEHLNHILEVSMSEFRKRGPKSVKMDDIASLLGMSKRTLYEIFQDKEDLLVASIEHHWGQVRKEMTDYAQKDKNILEVILYSFMIQLSYCKKMHPDFSKEMLRYPRAVTAIERNNEVSSKEFILALQIGVKEGLIRPDCHLDLFQEFLSVQLRGIYETSLWHKYSPTEVFRMILLVWIRGITTEAGAAIIDDFLNRDMNID